jgi:hypothetical protein
MEFKEAIIDLYNTLSETVTVDTEKFGVNFKYDELPDVNIKLTFEDTDNNNF